MVRYLPAPLRGERTETFWGRRFEECRALGNVLLDPIREARSALAQDRSRKRRGVDAPVRLRQNCCYLRRDSLSPVAIGEMEQPVIMLSSPYWSSTASALGRPLTNCTIVVGCRAPMSEMNSLTGSVRRRLRTAERREGPRVSHLSRRRSICWLSRSRVLCRNACGNPDKFRDPHAVSGEQAH